LGGGRRGWAEQSAEEFVDGRIPALVRSSVGSWARTRATSFDRAEQQVANMSTGSGGSRPDSVGKVIACLMCPRVVVDPFQDAPEQGALVPEVVIQRAPAHPRLAQDGFDRCAVESVFDEQLLGDRQQAFPGGRPALEVAVHVRLPSSTGRPEPALVAGAMIELVILVVGFRLVSGRSRRRVAVASAAAALLVALSGVAVLLPLSDRRAEPPAVPGESWWHLASGFDDPLRAPLARRAGPSVTGRVPARRPGDRRPRR